MIIKRFLCVKYNPKRPQYRPSARMTATMPALAAQEVAIKLSVNIPDELFVKPQLEASITVPSESVSPPIIDTEVLDNIEEVMQKTLGIDMSISLIEPVEDQ